MAREQFMVDIEFIQSGAAKAEYHVLGYWLRLSALCSARLLGGRLKGAKGWTDGVSFRGVGLPRNALDEIVVGELGWWDGDDLVLACYDMEGERLWKKQSKGGKDGNRKRWGNRTPNEETNGNPDSVGEVATDSEGDIGERIRDSESDSVYEDEVMAAAAAIRAREGLGHDADPRLLAAAACGAWMIDRKTGERLHEKWSQALGEWSPEAITKVFGAAKRLTGHEIHYPSGFFKALNAWVDENRSAKAKADQKIERIEADIRKSEQQAENQKLRDLSQAQVAHVDTWLQSPEGASTLQAIAANPEGAKYLAAARKHATGGLGANLSLHALARIFGELKPFLAMPAKPSEVSAS